MQVLVLTGGPASGKTSVAVHVGAALDRAGARYALVDLDWLCWTGPDVTGDALRGLLRDNLAAVAERYRSAGVEHLVLARSLRSAADLDAVRTAVPGAPLEVVELTVERATAAARLAARGAGDEQDDDLALVDVPVLDVATDHVVPTGTGSVAEVAAQVLRLMGWPAG